MNFIRYIPHEQPETDKHSLYSFAAREAQRTNSGLFFGLVQGIEEGFNTGGKVALKGNTYMFKDIFKAHAHKGATFIGTASVLAWVFEDLDPLLETLMAIQAALMTEQNKS
jgi:hypothetical protein